MKKLSIVFFLLLCVASSRSFGQSNAATSTEPKVTVVLGNIMPTITNGKVDASLATRAEILANPQLMTPPPPGDILGFTFSILPKGKDFIGPFTVTGSQLTPQIIKLLNDLEDPQGRIFIENIRVNVAGVERTAQPIVIKMVINKN